MTKRDFEFIAAILAEAETAIESVKAPNTSTPASDDFIAGMEKSRNLIRARFEDALAANHPRFNRGRFEVAASPIAHAELRNRILSSLKLS